MSEKPIDAKSDDALRKEIAERLEVLRDVEVFPRAENAEQINTIIQRLQSEAQNNLDEKLKIAGFTNYVVEAEDIPQPCETCMYYLLHRKFCDLPELMLPVEPNWSCRLWRI